MLTGTSHFVDRNAAIHYYRAYGFDARDVRRKLVAHEIHIGPPQVKAGERVETIDEGMRYAIRDANP